MLARAIEGRVPGMLALALGGGLLVLGVAASPATGRGAACEQWGAERPSQLTRKQARRAMQCLINEQRAAAGLPALGRSRKLQRAAQRHTRRMRGGECFAHQCAGESSLEARLREVGYLTAGLRRWLYAENIAYGVQRNGTPSVQVEEWMNSLSHRVQILDPALEEIGVGFSRGSPSRDLPSGGIYTADFGLRIG